MGNPTNLFFIREAVLLAQSAQFVHWPSSKFSFSTIEEFANEAWGKIRLAKPNTEQELAKNFGHLWVFYDLDTFFHQAIWHEFYELEDMENYGSVWVQNFEKGKAFWIIEDYKAIFSPVVQRKIGTYGLARRDISFPPLHYSPFQCLIHLTGYSMNLFEWQEMEDLVNGVDDLIKNKTLDIDDPSFLFAKDWKQIVDTHRKLEYDYAVFWSFV